MPSTMHPCDFHATQKNGSASLSLLLSFHNTFHSTVTSLTTPHKTSIMNQLAQAGQSNQRWPFRHYSKSPSAILAKKTSLVAKMSRKIRRLHLCGSDYKDGVIATNYTPQPSHRHVCLHATTWDDLLLLTNAKIGSKLF